MTVQHQYLAPFLTSLHNSGRLRVWSIVMTIFGDMVHPRQEPISVQELLTLTGHVGIGESALRTALSRLATEGWVERKKQGRLAFYTLGKSGQNTFLAASERIYNHSYLSSSPDWYLVAYNGNAPAFNERIPTGFTLTPQWRLINAEDRININNADVLLFKTGPTQLPTWANEHLIPDSLTQHYTELLTNLEPLYNDCHTISSMSPLTAMATRYLLIHAWRRLVLRHPLIPQELLPDDWPGAICHTMLSTVYPKLVLQAEPWWNETTSTEGKLTLEQRFKIAISE